MRDNLQKHTKTVLNHESPITLIEGTRAISYYSAFVLAVRPDALCQKRARGAIMGGGHKNRRGVRRLNYTGDKEIGALVLFAAFCLLQISSTKGGDRNENNASCWEGKSAACSHVSGFGLSQSTYVIK